MDFTPSERMLQWQDRVRTFMDDHVYPNEGRYEAEMAERRAAGDPHSPPPVLDGTKAAAREQGLWNLFFPANTDTHGYGAGLTNLEYAPLCEIMGRSPALAPESMNCSAPDTGNMELIAMFGTPEQRDRFLVPLLEGVVRSGFCMTEPDVASSDARNIRTSITADGDDYVIDGRKWWTTGALDPRCEFFIVMGRSDPDAPDHLQQSMILVPRDTAGVEVKRSLSVFGYEDRGGHGEVVFDGVRVPKENLLGEQGAGFALAQARLGPGRIHHCMRAIGLAERALELLCERAVRRVAFGRELARQGVVRDAVAESRCEIEQARLLVLKAAHLMDTVGAKAARTEIAAIKVVAARMATNVIDRAIQVHGGGGVSGDFPLAGMYAHARTLHLVDGPDEVHKMVIARTELAPYAARLAASGAAAGTEGEK